MGFDKKWQENFADINVHEELYNLKKKPLVSFFHLKRVEEIVKIVEKLKPKTLIEVACGDGFVLQEISKIKNAPKLTGVEISEKRIERCKSKPFKAEYILGDILKLPFKDNSFDAVVATEILEHIPNYQIAIAELNRIIKPGGHIIITFPNELNLRLGRLLILNFPIKFPDHFNWFVPGYLDKYFDNKIAEKNIPWGPFFFCLTHMDVYKKNAKLK